MACRANDGKPTGTFRRVFAGSVPGGALALLIVGSAVWLRFADLSDRPFHADEAATGARILADRLEGRYVFDPGHHHGPLLSQLTAPWCRINGETGWSGLTAVTLRRFTAAAGLLILLLIPLLVPRGGRLWSAAFTATSPLLVYYSRIYIHEPLYLLCCAAALAGLLPWLQRRPTVWSTALLGIGLGGMAATRETVVITLFAWAVAGGIALWMRQRRERIDRAGALHLLRHGSAALLIALLLTTLSYTEAGQRPAGIMDFLRTFGSYQTGAGHDKPWGYYAHLLLWPKHLIGRWWCEAAILPLAAGNLIPARDGRSAPSASLFLLGAGLLHLLIYSCIAYKTPWLASAGWLHLCLAAGPGAQRLIELLRPRVRCFALLLPALILIAQLHQSISAAFRFANDARNPYAYVPTLRDAEQIPDFIGQLRAAAPETADEPLTVVGEQYWPLPWYLRDCGPVAYLNAWPEQPDTIPILLFTASAAEHMPDSMQQTHVILPRGLRHNTPLFIAVRNDVWERYLP